MLSKKTGIAAFLAIVALAVLAGCTPGRGFTPPPFFSGGYSLIGLAIFVLDIVAIIRVAQSGATTLAKAVWIVVILVFPVVGLLIWLLMGPGRKG